MKIQIIGASGAGKSFLGRRLSEALNCTWVDTDDILWVWSDDIQPYTISVSDFDACSALKEKLDNNETIVASGLFYPWAEPLIDKFDLVISLTTDVNTRRKRIIDREIEMYGDRVSPFGDMYNQFQEFIKWSNDYDVHDDIYGSKKYTDIWLSKFLCPILKLDGSEDIDINLKKIKDFIFEIESKGVEKMIIPQKLKKGDKVAIVSLSSGMGGDKEFIHKYKLGKKRLEEVFGLNVITMSNALKGSKYLYEHPEKRAEDLMNAFSDKSIKGIICMIGGDDTIRLLPYIDFNIIKSNPKIFMGYSDTTINHFMMYKAGLTSYYGPAILSEFAENGKMHEYTEKYIREFLFNDDDVKITSSPIWTNDRIDWTDETKDDIERKMSDEIHGYEIIQGSGIFSGYLLGGCIDVFQMCVGTSIWPKDFKDKILFLETSEDKPSPSQLKYMLRNLVALGIIDEVNGIIFGKPKGETYYEEYKEVLKQVIGGEAGKKNLPILYNVNFGHSAPMCILPIGSKAIVDLDKKEITVTNK